MIEYKQNIPIKAQTGRVLKARSAEEKAEEARKQNSRDLAISQSYFDQAPSIQNIIKGIYHWARGSQYSPFSRNEDVDSYRYNTGTVPIVAAPARVVSAVVQSVPRWLTPQAILGTTATIGAASTTLSRSKVKPISRYIDLTSEAASDSTSTTATPRDSIAPESGTAPQGEQPEGKKGWRDKLADKVANKIRGKKPQEQKPETPKSQKSLGKRAWNAYKWSWYAPAAVDIVGNVVGAIKNPDTYSPHLIALKGRSTPELAIYNWLGNAYNPQPQKNDSTAVTPPNNHPRASQDTTIVYPLTEEDRNGYQIDSTNYAKRLMDAKRAAAIELAKDTL